MINKKNLWFLSLFSLVLVLSVYYITMPNELLLTNNGDLAVNDNDPNVSISDSSIISALRVQADEETMKEIDSLKDILTDLNISVDEKNLAFDELKLLNLNKGKEQSLEEKINKNYNVKSFIKIDNDQIRVVVGSSEHSASLANNIIRSVQEEFDKKMYISVQFQG